MAGFQLSIYGRFWVSTEGTRTMLSGKRLTEGQQPRPGGRWRKGGSTVTNRREMGAPAVVVDERAEALGAKVIGLFC